MNGEDGEARPVVAAIEGGVAQAHQHGQDEGTVGRRAGLGVQRPPCVQERHGTALGGGRAGLSAQRLHANGLDDLREGKGVEARREVLENAQQRRRVVCLRLRSRLLGVLDQGLQVGKERRVFPGPGARRGGGESAMLRQDCLVLGVHAGVQGVMMLSDPAAQALRQVKKVGYILGRSHEGGLEEDGVNATEHGIVGVCCLVGYMDGGVDGVMSSPRGLEEGPRLICPRPASNGRQARRRIRGR